LQLNTCLRTGSKTESKSIFRFFKISSETHFSATKVSGNFAAEPRGHDQAKL